MKHLKFFLVLDLDLELNVLTLYPFLSFLPLIVNASPFPNIILSVVLKSNSLNLIANTSIPRVESSLPYLIAALIASDFSGNEFNYITARLSSIISSSILTSSTLVS